MTLKVRRSNARRQRRAGDYTETWGSTIGQDCIDLDVSLTGWLGERLMFLAENGNTEPPSTADLRHHGAVLQEYAKTKRLEVTSGQLQDAKTALRWAADNLESLWD
jgi:hypothetical protein